MAPDASQLRSWLHWLRLKSGQSRAFASDTSGVAEKSIQRYEIEGQTPPADKFLALVEHYEALEELGERMSRGEWPTPSEVARLAEQDEATARRSAKRRLPVRSTSTLADAEREGGRGGG